MTSLIIGAAIGASRRTSSLRMSSVDDRVRAAWKWAWSKIT